MGFAYSGGSHAKGHESFFVGQNLIGLTLSLRLPGAEWFDDNGKLLPEAIAYFDLIKFKGESIYPIIHNRNDDSTLLAIAYEYNKGLEEGASLSDIFKKAIGERSFNDMFKERSVEDFVANEGSCLIDYAKYCAPLYKEVMDRGVSYYEEKGVSFNVLDINGNNQVRICKDKQNKLAMAAQSLMWDVDKARAQYKDLPDVATILQSNITGKYAAYVNGRFEAVPSQEDDRLVQAEMISFSDKLPEQWHFVANALSVGYTRFKKYFGITFSNLIGVSSCTDSRTPARVLLGASDEDGFRYYALRSPGNSWVEGDGKTQTLASRRYRAVAKLLGIHLVHSHHSVCGAMTAADQLLKKADTPLARALRRFGESKEDSFNIMMTRGKTEAERVAWYQKETGVAVQKDADCLGLEQLLIDLRLAQEKDPSAPVHGIFVNTSEGRNYIISSNRKLGEHFKKIPIIEALLPKGPVHAATLAAHHTDVLTPHG